jgi:tetratricopeptide (TPR) repeat protein
MDFKGKESGKYRKTLEQRYEKRFDRGEKESGKYRRTLRLGLLLIMACALWGLCVSIQSSGYLDDYPWWQDTVFTLRMTFGDKDEVALDGMYLLSERMTAALQRDDLQTGKLNYDKMAKLNKLVQDNIPATEVHMRAVTDMIIALGEKGKIGEAKDVYRQTIPFGEPFLNNFMIARRKRQAAYFLAHYLGEQNELDEVIFYIDAVEPLHEVLKSDYISARNGVYVLRPLTLHFLKEKQYAEAERMYHRIGRFCEEFPGDREIAREYLIAATWAGELCSRRGEIDLAEMFFQDAANLKNAFSDFDDYPIMRARTLFELLSHYAKNGDAEKARQAYSLLSVIVLPPLVDDEWAGWEIYQVNGAKLWLDILVAGKDLSEALRVYNDLRERCMRFEERSEARHARANAAFSLIAVHAAAGEFAVAVDIYDDLSKIASRFPEDFALQVTFMRAGKTLLAGYGSNGDLTNAEKWFGEIQTWREKLQNAERTSFDSRLRQIELLSAEAEAAVKLVYFYGRNGRIQEAVKYYRHIENLKEESGFFGFYFLPLQAETLVYMIFFHTFSSHAFSGDEFDVSSFSEEFEKIGNLQDALGILSENESSKLANLVLRLLENYRNAEDPTELQNLHDGILALRALSSPLKDNEEIASIQREVAERLLKIK